MKELYVTFELYNNKIRFVFYFHFGFNGKRTASDHFLLIDMFVIPSHRRTEKW
jgi:hypothetical protein